jgi:hypothetical protein
MSKHSKASVVAHAKPVAVPEPVETLDTPFERGIHDAIDPDLRHRMISEAAYYHFQQRGYAEGSELDDWLQAEAEIDHLIANRAPVSGSSAASSAT